MPGSRARPTIRDVAREAGVSVTTVSHAMNNKGRLDANTRARVIEIAESLGYVPNRAAQRLVSGKSLTIGVLMPQWGDIEISDSASTDWQGPIIFSAATHAVEAGYALTIMPKLPGDGSLGPHVVDGILLLDPRSDDARIPLLKQLGLPFVSVGTNPGTVDFPCVHSDDVDGVRQLLDHLRSLGVRSLGLLAPGDGFVYGERVRRLVEERWNGDGEELHVEVVSTTDMSPAAVQDAAERLAAVPDIDALAGLFPTFGAALLGAVNARGLSVPGDVLVTQNTDGVSAAVTSPPLTALDFRPSEQAALALQVLLDMLAGREVPQRQTVKPRLTVRTSTVARRRGDRMLARREGLV